MDETLSWDMHVDHISKKVKLRRYETCKNCVPSQSLIMYTKHLLSLILDIAALLRANVDKH